MPDYVVPPALAPLLGWSTPTLRRAVVLAEESERAGDGPTPLYKRSDTKREQDAALLTVERTPGHYLRWSRANAARVLRAFGKPVPPEWMASPAGQGAA